MFLIKSLGNNKDKNSANFIVVSEKNVKHFWVETSTLYPPFPTMLMRFGEKTAKSSATISPFFLLYMGEKHF